MPVDHSDPLVASGDKQLALDELLDGKNHAVLAPQSDGRAAILDRFGGIFYLPLVNIPFYRLHRLRQAKYLEVSAIGTEDRVGKIVTCAD